MFHHVASGDTSVVRTARTVVDLQRQTVQLIQLAVHTLAVATWSSLQRQTILLIQ